MTVKKPNMLFKKNDYIYIENQGVAHNHEELRLIASLVLQ